MGLRGDELTKVRTWEETERVAMALAKLDEADPQVLDLLMDAVDNITARATRRVH